MTQVSEEPLLPPPANRHAVHAVVDAGMRLLDKMKNKFSGMKVRQKNVTEAERVLHGEIFEFCHEKTMVAKKTGCPHDKWEPFVSDLGKRYNITPDEQKELLDTLLFDENDVCTREFVFKRGQGRVMFGMFVAVNNAGTKTIDVAYAFHTVEFRLKPDLIEHSASRKFLWWEWDKKTWTEPRERGLPTSEKEKFLDYFRYQSLRKFYQEGVIDNDPESTNLVAQQ